MGLWARIAGFLRTKAQDILLEDWSELPSFLPASSSGFRVNSFTAMQHVTVMACSTLLAEDVAKLPITLYRLKKNGDKVLATDQVAYKLLRKPNPWQTRFEFVEALTHALIMRGNGYAVGVRNQRGEFTMLVPVHPDRVVVYEAPDGEVFYCVARSGLHEMAMLESEPFFIPAEDVLHIRWLSGFNSLIGLSRIGLMQEAIGLGLAQEKMMGAMTRNGVQPRGVLQIDRKLPDAFYERMKLKWKEAHSGTENVGGTPILEEGVTWKPMSMTLADAQFLESRRLSAEDICRGFRVPGYKVGVQSFASGSRAGGSMLAAQDQDYVNNVISSYCERWEPKLMDFFGLSDEEYLIQFDLNRFLRADMQSRLTALRLGVMGMIYTPNEARRYEGLAPTEGGDTLYQPSNVAPIGYTPGPGANGPGSDLTGAPASGGDGDTPAEAEGAVEPV
jgi:HK97 family phage portal protein